MKIKDLTRSLRRHHLARLKKYRQLDERSAIESFVRIESAELLTI